MMKNMFQALTARFSALALLTHEPYSSSAIFFISLKSILLILSNSFLHSFAWARDSSRRSSKLFLTSLDWAVSALAAYSSAASIALA